MSVQYAASSQVQLPQRIYRRDRMISLSAILLLILLSFVPSLVKASSNSSNLRLGIGTNTITVSDLNDSGSEAPSVQQLDSTGVAIMAEYPQDEHKGSRFLVHYQQDSDSEIFGYETQLMFGWGLNESGLRLYTGPLWYRDHLAIEVETDTIKRKTAGWGWHLGIGYQYGDWIFEVASSVRDNSDYNNLQRDINGEGRPNINNHRLLISRRF